MEWDIAAGHSILRKVEVISLFLKQNLLWQKRFYESIVFSIRK